MATLFSQASRRYREPHNLVVQPTITEAPVQRHFVPLTG